MADLVPITVYISTEDKALLEEFARNNDRVLSVEARRAIRYYLDAIKNPNFVLKPWTSSVTAGGAAGGGVSTIRATITSKTTANLDEK